MAFKELSVVQSREVLRRWLHGDGAGRAGFAACQAPLNLTPLAPLNLTPLRRPFGCSAGP